MVFDTIPIWPIKTNWLPIAARMVSNSNMFPCCLVTNLLTHCLDGFRNVWRAVHWKKTADCELSKNDSAVMLCGNPAMLDEMESKLGNREMVKHRKKKNGANRD